MANSVALGSVFQLALVNNFAPVQGETFEIINNTGPNAISSTFANQPEGSVITSGPAQFRIGYVGGDGNDTVLTTLATANAGGPYAMTFGAGLTLDASASAADQSVLPLTYSWSINGNANASSLANPSLTWAQLNALGGVGSFTVRVQVSDSQGIVGTSSATVTVTQGTSTITWPTPANIVYGTALNAAQLDASANAAGTFTYSVAAGTVLNAGNQQALNVTFTPTDATGDEGRASYEEASRDHCNYRFIQVGPDG